MKSIWRKSTYKRTQMKAILHPSFSHESKSNQNGIKHVGQTVEELGASLEGRNSRLITAVLLNTQRILVRGCWLGEGPTGNS